MKKFLALFKDAYFAWRRDNPVLLAGALSYFSVFSLVPGLILFIAAAGIVWGESETQLKVLDQLGRQFSPTVANAVGTLLHAAQRSGAGVASLISGCLLLVVSSRVFVQLRKAINVAWGVEEKKRGLVVGILFERIMGFAMTIGAGLFIILFFIFDAGLESVRASLQPYLPEVAGLWLFQLASYGVSIVLFTLLFATLFRFGPEADVKWRDVWLGALVTSVLLTLFRFFLTLYFRFSDVASLYGAAGSLIVILLWIYFASQIFLYGAEFTWAYAASYGSHQGRKKGEAKEK